ncbi:gamma-glutamylcyclotransferase family protein [Pseudoxanthobacter sp. M-2]|uniref:gamma-glutamylcyclotransferase family protein n=1 Tax=Pseudoxanthobacter sp. M-2 TaxID=3078754 RepID=UPI0038FCD1C1
MATVMVVTDAAGLSPVARPDGDDLPLFLFGTLRDPALFEVVFGRPQQALACRPALLPGHVAVRVDGADFPVLIAAPACRQPGLLVAGLAAEEVARAVFYESTGYRLARVRLTVAGCAAEARAFLPTGRLPVSGERWRLAAWRRRHGARVVVAAGLAFQHYGRVDAAAFDALWPEIEQETAARLAASARPRSRRGGLHPSP